MSISRAWVRLRKIRNTPSASLRWDGRCDRSLAKAAKRSEGSVIEAHSAAGVSDGPSSPSDPKRSPCRDWTDTTEPVISSARFFSHSLWALFSLLRPLLRSSVNCSARGLNPAAADFVARFWACSCQSLKCSSQIPVVRTALPGSARADHSEAVVMSTVPPSLVVLTVRTRSNSRPFRLETRPRKVKSSVGSFTFAFATLALGSWLAVLFPPNERFLTRSRARRTSGCARPR